jgi:hypothetical protein
LLKIEVIKDIFSLTDIGTTGAAMLNGVFTSKGNHIGHNSVKAALKVVDPIKRRVYSVPGPLSLVHMDENHHLIRWKMVIHGCIDGFSRFVTFLDASYNNISSTVFELFMQSVNNHGLPSRVRDDCGVENVLVCKYMELRRGCSRGSSIAGKSIHNKGLNDCGGMLELM